ncbi:MAG: ABC transporter substrate-binding protein [Poseidonibacter sp.]|uniref:ABC transporter substrate-binding protein n=1 Tax=Poseidonibacter sp. TaxID=2321188 RepID=UPI00359E44BE
MIKRLPILIFIFILFYAYFKDETFLDKEIKIGTSLPMSGSIQPWGNAVTSGINSYFKYANEMKILDDKKINLLVYDDKYEPELTNDNVNKLIFQDNVYALFGFVGTPTVKSILPILYDENIPFYSAFTGASFLRNTSNKNFINFRSSYKEEIEKLVDYLYNKKDINKIAVFYQNDDYGEEGYVSLLKSLEKRELKLVAEGSYKRNTLSITHAFNEIKNAKPQAIIMVGAYKTNALFIKKAKENENLKDTIFCNISFSDANTMIKKLQSLNTNTDNLIFSQVVPNYLNTDIPVIQEYQTLMKKYYPNQELGFISLEAFLSSKVLVTAISKIKGDLTRKKLIQALKNTKSSTLNGLVLNYKKAQLLNKTYLFKYENSSFKEIQ